MFTFGRDHEIKHAINFIGNEEKAELLTQVINAVHDILEEKVGVEDAKPIFVTAFSEGKGGVWESTGKWIRKLGSEYPQILDIWVLLASNNKAAVRYKVACFLDEMPEALAHTLGSTLAIDKSKKVKSMAEARLDEISS